MNHDEPQIVFPIEPAHRVAMDTAAAVVWCERLRDECVRAGLHDDAVVFDMVREHIQREERYSSARTYTENDLLHSARLLGVNSEWTPERRAARDVLRAQLVPWTREQIETHNAAPRPLEANELVAYMDPVRAYLDSLGTDVSRAGMRHSLRVVYQLSGIDDDSGVAPLFFWLNFSAGQFAQIRAQLIERGYKPASVNHALSAVRGVVNQMWVLGYITKETAERLCSVKSVTNHIEEPTGREITLEEMRTILHRCALDVSDPVRGAAASRDAAILALLWSTGARRHEIAALSVSSVNTDTGEMHILGKGRKPRTVFVAGGALEALRAWFMWRNDDATPDAPLFPAIDRWGNVGTAFLSPESINRIVTRRFTDAGVAHLTPHDFRRTFVGNSLTLGIDILTVMGICGHSRVETTARYDRRKNEQRRVAASLVLTPYGA